MRGFLSWLAAAALLGFAQVAQGLVGLHLEGHLDRGLQYRSSSVAARTHHRRSLLQLSSTSALMSEEQQLTGDGGVVKEVLSRGTGKKVEAGDILAVEYRATLKDSGRLLARGDKEKFVFKDGSLIRGWDIGVGSMKVGEKARITCKASYAYGDKGVGGPEVVPPNADVLLEVRVLAWLGNQLRPESLFSKDLDIDPFIASTPETIQADYDDMKARSKDKYEGGVLQLYLNRLKNISFGFGGSGFFTSQSGERAPWYLNPNLTFPAMITIVLAAFITVLTTGSVKEKGIKREQGFEEASARSVLQQQQQQQQQDRQERHRQEKLWS